MDRGDGITDTTTATGSLPPAVVAALAELPSGVFVVPWPSDTSRRSFLEAAGQPRLLVVEPGAEIPVSGDCREDWVSATACTDEIVARARTLQAHADAHQSVPAPVIDPSGILSFNARVTTLGPIETEVFTALLPAFGSTVPLDQLAAHVESRGSHAAVTTADVPDVHEVVQRLRHAIAPLGLSIDAVGDLGYALSVEPFGPTDVPPVRARGAPAVRP